MNIVIVVIDALRARNLGCYGYDKITSPNIDKIAEKGIKFDKCFSCANCTDPSLTTILTGKNPISHGVTSHGETNWNENYDKFQQGGSMLLHEILEEEGFDIYNFDIGVAGPWLRESFKDERSANQPLLRKIRTKIGRSLRFNETLHKLSMTVHDRLFGFPDPRLPAESLTDRAINELEDNDNFYAMVHYWDVHIPYTPPEEYRKESRDDYEEGNAKVSEILEQMNELGRYGKFLSSRTDKTLSDVWADYDGTIRYGDDQIGRLAEELPDDTLLIVTADHGEGLGRSHPIYFSHGGLYDITTHVPLVMRHPDLPTKSIDSLVSHVDIAPTVLDLLDLDNPNDSGGESLKPLIDGATDKIHDEVFAIMGKRLARMIRTDGWKLIDPEPELGDRYWYNGDGEVELYDLKRDPDEQNNISDEREEVTNELLSKLDERMKEFEMEHAMATPRGKREKDYSDEVVRERLRELGYMSD